MSLLPFEAQPPFRPRTFVPAQVNWDAWTEIEPLFDRLEASLATVQSVADLEQWLLDWGELRAALDEESSRRYIAMTCHTDNPEAEKAYLHLVEQIDPKLKPRQFELSKRFTDHPVTAELPEGRYEVLRRDVALRVELFREENIPLETEEAKLEQSYQKRSGSLTVQFDGREQTLVQMGRYLEDPDRSLRENAWRTISQRRLQERDAFDDVFDQLCSLRGKIAANAGYDSYLDYAYRARGRFDYGTAECEAFHDAVAAEVVPLLQRIQQARRSSLGLESLRPWDTAVDPKGRSPLQPFTEISTLTDASQAIFDKLDPDLSGYFRLMQEKHLLDLENRKGKAPGGYQCSLDESRLPFIFMNAVGLQRDVETMLHEAGHAFHAMAARSEDLQAYRHAPIEFCEVASMSMELLGNDHIEAFYSPADANRARLTHLEGVLSVLPWIATVDAFQHWIYRHPGHSREERRAAWTALMERFGGDVDWTGLEEARANLWHRQLHIFIHPFYYIEYGIAQLGALQLWVNSRSDAKKALEDYKHALSLGGSRPLPQLFEACGCRFDFSAATIAPLMQSVGEALETLAGQGA